MEEELCRKFWSIPRRLSSDFLPLNGTDYVEFYVGNARQAAYFYRTAFGFRLAAYRGPETGVRDRASYVLVQNKIRFVLTTPLAARTSGSATHVRLHGDGVHDIALWVDDAESAWRETTARGARSVREPATLRDEHGEARIAAIATYGDTIHSFVERRNYRGVFLPGFRAVEGEDPLCRPVGLKYIDHMVGNVGWGEMDRWVDFYRDVHGLPDVQALRRQRHLHGILGADVEGDVERQRAGEVPDQRAGHGQAEIADRRVSRVFTTARACSTSRWPPTISSTPSGRCGARASIFCACPSTYYDDLMARVGHDRRAGRGVARARHPGGPRR